MRLIKPGEFIVNELGGITATANMLSDIRGKRVPPTTVQAWKVSGMIRQEHWADLMKAGEQVGKTFKLEDFVNEHEVEDEAEGVEAAE